MSDSNGEIKRRIETAFAAGDFSLCLCEACGDEKTSTHRVDGEIKTYCDECWEEIKEIIEDA